MDQLPNYVFLWWARDETKTRIHPPWIPAMGEYHCTVHGEYAHSCPCPSLEEWEIYPYECPDPIQKIGNAAYSLNPSFLEALLGFPVGWTDTEPSETL